MSLFVERFSRCRATRTRKRSRSDGLARSAREGARRGAPVAPAGRSSFIPADCRGQLRQLHREFLATSVPHVTTNAGVLSRSRAGSAPLGVQTSSPSINSISTTRTTTPVGTDVEGAELTNSQRLQAPPRLRPAPVCAVLGAMVYLMALRSPAPFARRYRTRCPPTAPRRCRMPWKSTTRRVCSSATSRPCLPEALA